MPIATAVVPLAGLGTRLRPLTYGVPKGLLPVGGQPVAHHIVDELARAGIARVVLVTSAGGRDAFAAHFDAVDTEADLVYVEQPEPRGLGDALLHAEAQTGGEPFVLALGDAIVSGDVVARLVSAFEEADPAAAVAVEEVPAETASRYGIVVGATDDEAFAITSIVEKPAVPPSRLAIAARYVLAPAALVALRTTPPAPNGELQLSDALAGLIAKGASAVGVRLRPGERRLDVGALDSYGAAFLELALADPLMGPTVRARARVLLNRQP